MPSPAEPESFPTSKPARGASTPNDAAVITPEAPTKKLAMFQEFPWIKLFETALDAMLIADDDGYYRDANPAACALLDLPRQALVGRRISDFLSPEVDFDAVWQHFLALGQARGEQQLVLLNGVIKAVEFSATAHIYPNHHLSILRDITDRKRIEAERDTISRQLEQWIISSAEKLEITESQLRSQQQRTESILNSLDCVVWSVQADTFEMIYINAAAEAIYGYVPESFLADANLWLSCIHPEDWPLLIADMRALLQAQKIDREYRIFRADGEIRWVRSQANLVRDEVGQPLRIDGTTLDVTERAKLEAERKQAELSLRNYQATQQAILEAIPDLLMRVNRKGYILNLISGGEINLYGHIHTDQCQSLYVNFPADLADQRLYYVRLALATGTRQIYEHAIELDGRLHYEESRVVPLSDTEALIIVRDITDRKQAEATQAELNQKLQLVNAELNRLATVDGLTQIANRRSFDEALDLEWQRARRQQQSMGLILCDIDYFKPYNDNYGHLAGDDCLRQVAQVLNTVVRRPGDMAARYGGEEFVLLLPDTTLEGALQIVEQVQEAIAAQNLPHGYSRVSPVLTLSFGLVCHCPTIKEHSPRELIHRADVALYEAKARGRNRYVVSQGQGQGSTS